MFRRSLQPIWPWGAPSKLIISSLRTRKWPKRRWGVHNGLVRCNRAKPTQKVKAPTSVYNWLKADFRQPPPEHRGWWRREWAIWEVAFFVISVYFICVGNQQITKFPLAIWDGTHRRKPGRRTFVAWVQHSSQVAWLRREILRQFSILHIKEI